MHKVPLTDARLPDNAPDKKSGEAIRDPMPSCPECGCELVPSRRAAGKWLCVSCKIRFDEKDVMPEGFTDHDAGGGETRHPFDEEAYEEASRWLGGQLSRLSAELIPDMPKPAEEHHSASSTVKEKLAFAWAAIKELFPSGRKGAHEEDSEAPLVGKDSYDDSSSPVMLPDEPEPDELPQSIPEELPAEQEDEPASAGPATDAPEPPEEKNETAREPQAESRPEPECVSEAEAEPECELEPVQEEPIEEQSPEEPGTDGGSEAGPPHSRGAAPVAAREELPYLDDAFVEDWDDLEEELPFAAEMPVPRGGYSRGAFAPVPTRMKRRSGRRRPLATENRSAILMAGGAAGAFIIILGFVIFLITGNISSTGSAGSAGNESNSAMNAVTDMLSTPSSNANSVDRNAGDSYNAQDSSITENEAIRRLDEANGGHSVSEKMHDIPKIEGLKKQAEEEQKARDEAKKAAEEAEAAEKASKATTSSSNSSAAKNSSNKNSSG